MEDPPRTDSGAAAARVPWGMTGLVLGVLALAHVGLFLLLTVDARSSLRGIRAAYTQAELDSARDPGPAPPVGTADYTSWARARTTWEKARDARHHAGHRDTLAYGLFASWLGQAAFIGYLLSRTARRRVRPAGPGRASTSG